MGRLRCALDAQFWGQEIASPTSLDGVVRALPGEAIPLGLAQGSKLSRPQQVLFLHRFFWLPVVPSYVADPEKGGGFVLDRVLAHVQGLNWWAALTGQFRVQQSFSYGQGTVSKNIQSSAASGRCNPFKYLLNQSLYALGLCSRISLGPHTSLTASSEFPGNKKGCRSRAIIRHKLQRHDVTMEAAWHERFVETQGSSWDVPLSISLDLASLSSTSGLRYRLAIHHNAQLAQESKKIDCMEIPWGALPGLCAKGAIAVEKHVEIWKDRSGQQRRRKPYNLFLARPHIMMSGIIGVTYSAILGGGTSSDGLKMLPIREQSRDNDTSDSLLRINKQKSPFFADVFASLGCTAQFGNFQRPLFDLTKLETRLDISKASTFAAGTAQLLHKFKSSTEALRDRNELDCPALSVMLQQQIAGPLCARIDSRFTFDCSSSNQGLHMKEIIYGLDYSLKSLGAAKLLIWYSPRQQEGMVELRFLER
eukprot:Gb_04973 [translate_table: standard]